MTRPPFKTGNCALGGLGTLHGLVFVFNQTDFPVAGNIGVLIGQSAINHQVFTQIFDYSAFACDAGLNSPVRPRHVVVHTGSGCDQGVVRHKPRLLSDSGSCYISGDLAEWLEGQSMKHVLGAPFHSQIQGKIERWHQTMKNWVLLENYFLPGDLERLIGAFVKYCNNQRYHESLNNVTPADVYFGRDKAILRERKRIKKQTIQQRRLQHQKQAA